MGPRCFTASSIISTARLTPKQKPISLARIICIVGTPSQEDDAVFASLFTYP